METADHSAAETQSDITKNKDISYKTAQSHIWEAEAPELTYFSF